MYNKLFKNVSILLLVVALILPHIVLALDIDSQPENVSISAIVAGSILPGGGGGGGGGGYLSGLIFSGWAYPKASVHILKDGVPVTTTIADKSGYFTITFSELYNPSVLYTLYAIDQSGRRSILLNYPVATKVGYYTEISGIIFPPTISTDKTEVKLGDTINVTGYARPSKDLDVTVEGVSEPFHTISGDNGIYQLPLSLKGLPKGSYNVHSNYQNDKKISKVIQFIIGDLNISSVDLVNNLPGDCNADQIINIVDFSVAAFWYGKPNPPKCVDTNNDNIIDLIDFSILAFYWTG